MVGSTIPYSPFEHAVNRPKLNAMQYCYGVGLNFITGASPEFEDLLTLRLCMKPKYNDLNCAISKLGNTILVKLELWELVIVFNNNFYSATNLCLCYALAKCGR